MAATLLAMYKRPEGGDDALNEFWRRYREEHMPLIDKVPGLQSTKIWNVARGYVGEDLIAVVEMRFEDLDALKAAMRSAEMQTAGSNIADIAPGLMTLVALEESWA